MKEDIKKLIAKIAGGDLESLILVAERPKTYREIYSKVKERRAKGDSWPDIYTTDIYCDDPQSNEIMIRIVEEEIGGHLKDAKHLQAYTDISKELIKELEETFCWALEYRYSCFLDYMLTNGAKYQELLEVEPQDFRLPEKWKGFLQFDGKTPADKNISVGYAIIFRYSIMESSFCRPSLREIAEATEAPYSFILEAYKNFK